MKFKHLVAALLWLVSFAVLAGPAVGWEIRKRSDGTCVVKKIGEKPAVGTRLAGPFSSEKDARRERDRLKLTPKCR